MTSDRRAVRNVLLGFAAVAAVALAAIVVSVAGGHDVQEPSPQDTVRDFLVTTVVDSDGVDACGYLTAGAVRSLSALEPRDMTCHEALSDTKLEFGGTPVATEAQIEHLRYSVTESHERARVTVSAHGARAGFSLRRATKAELGEAGAPPGPWRIASGVNRLAVR